MGICFESREGEGFGFRRRALAIVARLAGAGSSRVRPSARRRAAAASRGRVAARRCAGACVTRLGLGATAAYVAAESRLALARCRALALD